MTQKTLPHLLTLLTALLLLSCTGEDSGQDSFFNSDFDYKPAPTTHQVSFDNIYHPRKMRVIGDFLAVDDYQNQVAFHVLKTGEGGDLEYHRAEDNVGPGPGEFQLVDDFIETDSLIYIYDGAQLKMVSYNKNFTPADADDIHMRIDGRPVTMNALSNNRFATAGLFYRDRFQVFDAAGNIIGNHGEQINISDDFNPHHLGTIWFSQSVSHPDEDFIYLFSMNADFIEKYDSEGNLITRVQGSEFPLPKMRLETQSGQPWPVDDGGKAAYTWVDADENHIYALYSGNMRSEENALYTNKVHLFNWDLELIEGYELDHRTHMIAADGKGGIYSLTSEGDGAVIRYIDLMN